MRSLCRTGLIGTLLLLLLACDELRYRETLEIEADRSGRLTIELEMRRLAGLTDILGPAVAQDLPLIAPERLEEPLPEGLELITFEDRSNDERFDYLFVVGFDDVAALRQIDSLMPAAPTGDRTYLFRGLTWEEQGEGRWLYRRQLGDGTLPESAELRRRFGEMDLSFELELRAPDSIGRTNASSTGEGAARWKVNSQDILNEGGRVVLHAEVAPPATTPWIVVPIALAAAGILWAARRRGRRKA